MLKTKGIVFRTVKYGETSVITDIFTEEKGLHTFIGGGVRSAKARMPYSLFQPMMVVELVAYYKDDPNRMVSNKRINSILYILFSNSLKAVDNLNYFSVFLAKWRLNQYQLDF